VGQDGVYFVTYFTHCMDHIQEDFNLNYGIFKLTFKGGFKIVHGILST
jgi:hypothetical protein